MQQQVNVQNMPRGTYLTAMAHKVPRMRCWRNRMCDCMSHSACSADEAEREG